MQQAIICQCRPVNDRTGAALSAPAGQGDRYRQWRLCPQVRVADIVRVAPDRKSGSREWWQLFRPVSQWHCDVVITDRAGRIIAAVELDDRSHQEPKRQRRDLLLEEVLKQAGIPLLRGDNEQQLAARVRAHLCAQRPEAAA